MDLHIAGSNSGLLRIYCLLWWAWLIHIYMNNNNDNFVGVFGHFACLFVFCFGLLIWLIDFGMPLIRYWFDFGFAFGGCFRIAFFWFLFFWFWFVSCCCWLVWFFVCLFCYLSPVVFGCGLPRWVPRTLGWTWTPRYPAITGVATLSPCRTWGNSSWLMPRSPTARQGTMIPRPRPTACIIHMQTHTHAHNNNLSVGQFVVVVVRLVKFENPCACVLWWCLVRWCSWFTTVQSSAQCIYIWIYRVRS